MESSPAAPGTRRSARRPTTCRGDPCPPTRCFAALALLAAASRPAAAQPPGYGPLARHYDVSGCFDARLCGTGTIDVWSGATNWLLQWNTAIEFLAPGYLLPFAAPQPFPTAFSLDYEGAGDNRCPLSPEVPGAFVAPLFCTFTGDGRVPIGYDMSTFNIAFMYYHEGPRPGTLPRQVNFTGGTLVLAPTTAPEPATVGLVATGLLAPAAAAPRRARSLSRG